MPPSLARRLLFPAAAPDALPPLVKSDVPEEFNAELYDILALALRAFVTPWWSKISRYDKDFLPEITNIISQVIPAIETRLLAAEFPALVLRDLPLIITQHYRDYRSAELKLATSYTQGGSTSLPQIFHQLQPHIAVSPEGCINEQYYRCVFDHILECLLPREAYAPEAERTIIREILLKVVLHDVLPKITQPWFILKVLSDVLDNTEGSKSTQLRKRKALERPNRNENASFSFHTLLVLLLSAIQTISGLGLALIDGYRNTIQTIKRVNESRPFQDMTQSPLKQDAAPPSSSPSPSPAELNRHFAEPGLDMVCEIISANERFSARLIIGYTSMVAASFPTFVDRFLLYTLHKILSSPHLGVSVIRVLKRTMFPNGYPVPAPPPPTLEEQAAMRARIILFRPQGALAHLSPFLLGHNSEDTLARAIAPLDDAICNTHLIVLLIDRIVLSLFPELATKSIIP